MYSKYDTLFEQYLVDIALTNAQAKIIDSKLNETLALFLSEFESDIDIYAQGSYAMGTIVKPLTSLQSGGNPGEYDVDIVLERGTWDTPKTSLGIMRDILFDEYDTLLDTKLRESCERVNHMVEDNTGVGFHVDYVPIKHNLGIRKAAKRSQDLWFPSDTRALIEWFDDFVSEYTFLPAMVLVLKRARDLAGLTDSLSSITITALVCELYEDLGTYADDLLGLLSKITNKFTESYSMLSITIPVINGNLADKFSESDYNKVQNFFNEIESNLSSAFESDNMETIRDYLSDDFPLDWTKFPIFLEALRTRDWGLQLDGSLNVVDIEGNSDGGMQKSKRRWSFSDKGSHLKFKANTDFVRVDYGIRWQVLNSEESGSNRRRGKLFEAKSPGGGKNSNEFVNFETEQYHGEHWIKYYIYNKQSKKVEEIGRKFYVEVDSPGDN